MTQDQMPRMRLARGYLSRANGLWRRHKTRAVLVTILAVACAAGWLAKHAATRAVRHVRAAAKGDG